MIVNTDSMRRLMDGAAELGVEIDVEKAVMFMDYMGLILEWNKKMNLTAITDPADIVIKHFLDSLTVVGEIGSAADSVIDVGCGAGLPGLPLKFARPDITLCLMDSLNKRIGFLEHVVAKLGLSGVTCVHSRAEDGGQSPNHREQYAVAVSRAVASMDVLCEYCLPFVRVGGQFIAMKGPDVSEELETAKPMIAALGGEIARVCPVLLPSTQIEHTLIVINKLEPTPSKYPRKPGKIPKPPARR